MAFLATEDTTLMSKNMMDNHLGWTSIFGTSSGGNSVGSSDSEASVNQPAPDSPEPELPLRLISQMETPQEWGSIIAAQAVVEERIEAALVRDGFNAQAAILAKGHQHSSCALPFSALPGCEKDSSYESRPRPALSPIDLQMRESTSSGG
ncbi:hypothetical protein Lal_00038480 [Lupinus albus]|nr:hypothetical protein Lal_00038480 [Lupinus albus]